MRGLRVAKEWVSNPRHYTLILILLVSASTVTGSAVANNKPADVILLPGSDSTSCNPTQVYPCASVTVAIPGKDRATVSFSFRRTPVQYPQPATYYTNLLRVYNGGTVAHTVKSVQVQAVTGVSILGKISVYYCTVQTDAPATSPNCAKYDITSGSTHPPYSLSASGVLPNNGIPPGGYRFIEMVAFASISAPDLASMTFMVSIAWS